jgi:hypothetical protein
MPLTVRPSEALTSAEEAEVGEEGARLLDFLAPDRAHQVRVGRAGAGPDL